MMLMTLMVLGAMGASLAQTNTAPNAVKLTKYILGVADLDKSVTFYQALGIELDGKVGQPQPLPDFLLKLVDVPKGTKFRNAMMKIPGADFALELTEFTGMELHPGRERIQDPGATLLILDVRSLSTALTAAKTLGSEVVTIGGAPVAVRFNGREGRAITVKDPDGFYIEIGQPPDPLPTTTAAANSNIIGGWFASIVEDTEKSAGIYRDRFGFAARIGNWTSLDMENAGTPGAHRRAADLTVPGTTLRWRLLEWKDIDRKSYRLRIPDPGAPAIGLEVRDLDAAAAAFKAAGGSVITQGGSIQLPNGGKVAFMRDPNGILVEVAQPVAK
jgi:catechol 2,3-dioxygenase-like lactoylglutathione lyase family enzyme